MCECPLSSCPLDLAKPSLELCTAGGEQVAGTRLALSVAACPPTPAAPREAEPGALAPPQMRFLLEILSHTEEKC